MWKTQGGCYPYGYKINRLPPSQHDEYVDMDHDEDMSQPFNVFLYHS